MNEDQFEVETLSKYESKISKINNIEDAVDVTYNREELKEMFGDDVYFYSSSVVVKHHLISAYLTDIRDKAREDNKVSALVKDTEILRVIVDNQIPVSRYFDHASRVGNRVFFRMASNKVLKLTNAHFSLLSNICHRIVGSRSKGYSFSLTYANYDKPASIALYKRLVDWSEFSKDDLYTSQSIEDQQFVKQLWDSPTLLEKYLDKKQ
jgi:hypothetical protein